MRMPLNASDKVDFYMRGLQNRISDNLKKLNDAFQVPQFGAKEQSIFAEVLDSLEFELSIIKDINKESKYEGFALGNNLTGTLQRMIGDVSHQLEMTKEKEKPAILQKIASRDRNQLSRDKVLRQQFEEEQKNAIKDELPATPEPEKPFDPKDRDARAASFDMFKLKDVISAEMKGVMGGDFKGKFQIGRRSKSKKYNVEMITLYPIVNGEVKKPRKGFEGMSRYRLFKRPARDGGYNISAAIGDMGIDIVSLGRPEKKKSQQITFSDFLGGKKVKKSQPWNFSNLVKSGR